MSDKTNVLTLFDSETILASASADSVAIPLDEYRPDGYFSIEATVTGDGTCKFEYELSHAGTSYAEPEGVADLATGLTKTSGPGSDGFVIILVPAGMAPYMQIKCTETGGANSVTIDATIAVK